LQGVRSLAANVAIEMPEAAAGSGHYRILFLSALVLLVFTLTVNTLAELIRQRLRRRYSQQEETL
jgi:phosphate transport system permease protein